MIILLDLNYTLVSNNPARGTTPERMEKRLANEQYRQWLVELVRPHTVVLITARPETWTIKTLDRIEEQTGWRPQDACFAPKGWWNPPAIKEHLLKKMYAKFSIPCFWVTPEGTCLTEGTRIVKRLPR